MSGRYTQRALRALETFLGAAHTLRAGDSAEESPTGTFGAPVGHGEGQRVYPSTDLTRPNNGTSPIRESNVFPRNAPAFSYSPPVPGPNGPPFIRARPARKRTPATLRKSEKIMAQLQYLVIIPLHASAAALTSTPAAMQTTDTSSSQPLKSTGT